MIGDINLSLDPQRIEVWLAKPNRDIIAKLTGKTPKKNKMITFTQLIKGNNINEIEFTVPFQVTINHQLVDNPVIDKIKDRFLLKTILNSQEEWYLITNFVKSMTDNADILKVSARSLGYELIGRTVRQLDLAAVNLSTIMNGGAVLDSKGNSLIYGGLLQPTNWILDPSYDVTFDTIYRSLNISKASILDVLLQISETYNGIIVWDTINRKINFQQLKNLGQDKGLKISPKNYMQNVDNTQNSDELATRFIPIGQNNLSISSVNPTAKPWMDNFDHFLFPFSRDVSKNVIKSSYYFSDGLSNAIVDYSQLLSANATNFSTLLATLTSEQVILTTKTNEMADLVTGLKTIQNSLDIAQSVGASTTTLLTQQSSQNALIATKQSEINTANANIATTQASITALNNTLSSANNFTQSQLSELNPYIIEKEWNANSITDAQSLYDQGLVEFAKFSSPQTIVKVSLVNFLQIVSEQRNWRKLGLFDTIGIENTKVDTSIKARLVELNFDHVAGTLELTIADTDDLLRDEEKVYKMLYQGISANSSLSVNTDRWNGIDQVTNNVNAIYNSGINSALINVNSGSGSTTKIDGRGFTSANSTASTDFIRINNGTMIFSGDGGTTANIAVDKTGIYANKLVGQIIIGSSLTIANSAGNFSVNGSGATISDMNLTITRSDQNSRILLDPTNGIKIQNKVSGSFVDKFYADSSGNLFANSLTLATPSISNGTIVGTSINVGSGNFVVTSGGIMSCTGANVSGNISAINGNFSGNITSTATITGGVIRSSSSYPRAELNSTNNLIGAYNSATRNILVGSYNNTTGAPYIQLNDSASSAQMDLISSQFKIQSNVPMVMSGSSVEISPITATGGRVTIYPAYGYGEKIHIPHFADIYGDFNGQTLQDALDLKTDTGSTTSSVTVTNHNHGIPDGTVLMKSDGTFITFVASGGFTHSHTTN